MTDDIRPIEPARSALLVMDYQRAIVGSIEGGDQLLARTAAAIATARQARLRIGYVRVAFTADDVRRVPANNKAFSAMAGTSRFDDAAPETQVHEAVAPESGDIVVRKTRVGAFSTTDLGEQLRTAGIDTLVLAGIATSGVILSTIRDAADKDYRLVVLEDCCADRDPEVHRVLMEKVFPRQSDVISSADLERLVTSE